MVTSKVLLQAYPYRLGAFHIPASKLCNSETKVFISALHFCISPTSASVITGRNLGEHAAPLVLQAERGRHQPGLHIANVAASSLIHSLTCFLPPHRTVDE